MRRRRPGTRSTQAQARAPAHRHGPAANKQSSRAGSSRARDSCRAPAVTLRIEACNDRMRLWLVHRRVDERMLARARGGEFGGAVPVDEVLAVETDERPVQAIEIAAIGEGDERRRHGAVAEHY